MLMIVFPTQQNIVHLKYNQLDNMSTWDQKKKKKDIHDKKTSNPYNVPPLFGGPFMKTKCRQDWI